MQPDIFEAFRNTLNSERIYTPDQLPQMISDVRHWFRFAWTNRKLRYFDVPAAFDIETSSFLSAELNPEGLREKRACMYEWTFGLFGAVMIGRTWEQFDKMIHSLASVLDLGKEKRLIVFVHNLEFEFQFFCKRFQWAKVFAIDVRKPLYALTDFGIEFRCSYQLSGYSLDELGKTLTLFPDVRKAVGDLDYHKIRHAETELTDEELEYCRNDVRVVMAYIAERMQFDGSISKLPRTKTGYVREYCRNACFYENGIRRKKSFKRLQYMQRMRGLTLTPEEYEQNKRGFAGGYTHASAFRAGKDYRGRNELRLCELVSVCDGSGSVPMWTRGGDQREIA